MSSTESGVLVTGGAGYIGSHTVLALREGGWNVVVIDDLSTGRRDALDADTRLIEGNAGDRALLESVFAEHEIDAVIHFAGSTVVDESVANPLKYYQNNTGVSLALIDASVTAGVRHFVFSSTAAVYGIPDANPVDEKAPTRPISPYGRSKLMTEHFLRDVGATGALNYAALRYFNVAGADRAMRTGQCTPRATHLIKVACQTALGLRDTLEIYGDDYDTPDGTCIRDYIHVSDLAAAHVAMLERLRNKGESGMFNLGYGRGFSVREVIAALEKETGRPVPHRVAGRRPGDPPALVADSARLKSLIDWHPRHDDLTTIVRTAYDWECRLAAMH